MAAKSREPEKAKEIFTAMEQVGIRANTVRTCLWHQLPWTSQYLQCPASPGLPNIYPPPSFPTLQFSYSALITALGRSGRMEEALSVFNTMQRNAKTDRESAPNTVTYSSVISACEKGGRVDLALRYWVSGVDRGVCCSLER